MKKAAKKKPTLCKMCGDKTNMVVNINFKAVHLCDPCATTIMMQQINWMVKNKKS